MIILDTNVISAIMQVTPNESVVAWLDHQPSGSIWTTAITVFEVEFGLQRLAKGKRRKQLESAFQSMLMKDLEGRVLAFDTQAALASGALCAELQAPGQTIEIRDIQIAGIARARQATVATRNVKHFELACETVNPWE